MYENNGYNYQQHTENTSGSGMNGYYPYAAQMPRQTEKEKKHSRRGKTVALVLACSLLSGCTGAAAVTALNRASAGNATLVESARTPVSVDVVSKDSGKLMTAAEVYAANVNSTVGITTSVITTFFGFRTTGAAAGSGFIISDNGYIVTNYHVVEGSTSIKVTTYDNTSYDAALVGYDESNDVAVLKIDATGLTPATMGSSEGLNVGDEVVAIGNPLGELTFSLTKGNVSAKDRTVTLSGNVTMKLIQTDAAINSGNSGGALFNMYGEVVGITNAKYSGSSSTGEASIDNIGFAIPLDSVKTIITDIIEKGYAAKPYIGVQLSDAADAALIYSVTKGSPAEKAGLQANDIVTAANGKAVTSADDLTAIVKAMEPGDTLTLTVTRGGQETELTVTVGEQTDAQSAQSGAEDSRNGRSGSGRQYGNSDGTEGYGSYGDGSDGYGSYGFDPEEFGEFFGIPFGGSGEYYHG